MSPQKQKIAIAKACGWTHIFHEQGDHVLWGLDPETGYQQMLPRYLIDLNAMHKAEKTLNRGQRNGFRGYLGQMFPRDEDRESTGWEGMFGRAIHADAAQRAEAFLRALGKWEETTP